jgi:predicted RNase H-like nuclease (RuvC/YqgF family)
MTAPGIAEANTSLAQAADRLVRELLDREAMMQQLRGAKDSDAFATESLSRELSERDRTIDALSGKREDGKSGQEPASVVQLRKQIAERDKKIAELSSKLEALKRIDQETREKVRPIRPPSAIPPAPMPDAPQ